jgi:hypothetical protein
MRKLKLDIDGLDVQSFVTGGEMGRSGTVHGQFVTADTDTCTQGAECHTGGSGSLSGGMSYDCPYTQRYYSCDPAICGLYTQNCTAYASCNATCTT